MLSRKQFTAGDAASSAKAAGITAPNAELNYAKGDMNECR